MVRALLHRNDSRVDILDKSQKPAIYYAIENGHCDIAVSLMYHGEPAKSYELEPQMSVFWYVIHHQLSLLDHVRQWVVANLGQAGREIGQQRCFQKAAESGCSDVVRECFYLPGIDFNAPSDVSDNSLAFT